MLEKIRRPGRSYRDGALKKFFSYIIFGLICVVFLFIAPMGTQMEGRGVAAKVGPHIIRSRELRNLEENIKRQHQSRFNSESDSEDFQKQIKHQALQHLIDLYLINISAEKEGFFITDQELRGVIHDLAVFQEEGRFLYSRYTAFLKNQKLSPNLFEERIRRSKMGEVWSGLFNKAAPSNKLEKIKKTEKYQYKVNFQYVELKAEEVEEERLATLLKSQDKSGVDRFLSSINVKWLETGVFPLILPIGQSIAQNEKLMQAVISRLPEKGLISRLIKEGNKVYAVNILSFSKEEMSPEEERLERLFSRNFEKSDLLFRSWLSVQTEKIKVQKQADL